MGDSEIPPLDSELLGILDSVLGSKVTEIPSPLESETDPNSESDDNECSIEKIDECLLTAIKSNDSDAIICFLQGNGELQHSKIVLREAADNHVSPDIMRTLLKAARKNILDWFTELD